MFQQKYHVQFFYSSNALDTENHAFSFFMDMLI